jgi:ubiquitin carboxyl-terminal hydrolase MINDY-1/2
MTEALIIESFLERSASQLTYHGLVELSRAMNEGEVAVLFRNNHFSTILKQQDMVLQLVTDQGFLSEPNVVWETLNSIDGDGQFVDGYFRPVPPKPEPRPVPGETNVGNLSTEQQIDQE